MRCLKRKLSDALFRALVADLNMRLAQQSEAVAGGRAQPPSDVVTRVLTVGPGGQSGATLQSSATGPTPAASSSDKSLPGPTEPDATPATALMSAPA